MDTQGNIRRFADIMEAEHEGFTTQLTRSQAKALDGLPLEERHAGLVKLRHAEYLEKLKAAEYDGLQGRNARRAAKPSGKKRAHKYR